MLQREAQVGVAPCNVKGMHSCPEKVPEELKSKVCFGLNLRGPHSQCKSGEPKPGLLLLLQ